MSKIQEQTDDSQQPRFSNENAGGSGSRESHHTIKNLDFSIPESRCLEGVSKY